MSMNPNIEARSCCSSAADSSACCDPVAKAEAIAAGATCCSGVSAEETALLEGGADDVRTLVRQRYGAIAEGASGGAGCCGGPSSAAEVLAQVGYSADQAADIPEGANLGLGCGNPIAHAALKPGETVLDLGSGGGIDCFLASREVAPDGRVIGVDMTPAMVERARDNARRGGYANVEFRLGEIEHLPVPDGSIDAILSNCVVNLSPEKAQVFREAYRALRPGGRMLLSDLVWTRELPSETRHNVDLYCGCVAGASLKQDYLALIREAGFRDVEVVSEGGYRVGVDELPDDSAEREAFRSVASVKVRALK